MSDRQFKTIVVLLIISIFMPIFVYAGYTDILIQTLSGAQNFITGLAPRKVIINQTQAADTAGFSHGQYTFCSNYAMLPDCSADFNYCYWLDGSCRSR